MDKLSTEFTSSNLLSANPKFSRSFSSSSSGTNFSPIGVRKYSPIQGIARSPEKCTYNEVFYSTLFTRFVFIKHTLYIRSFTSSKCHCENIGVGSAGVHLHCTLVGHSIFSSYELEGGVLWHKVRGVPVLQQEECHTVFVANLTNIPRYSKNNNLLYI